MTNGKTIARRKLTWVETCGDLRSYQLREGDEVIGHLTFETEMGTRASAELLGSRWTLERRENWHTRVDAVRNGDRAPEATFRLSWAGGGVVECRGGSRYCWNRSHVWSATYCFRRGSRRATLCITQEAPSSKGSAVTVCDEALNCPETPLLIVLGWFLEVLLCEVLAEGAISW